MNHNAPLMKGPGKLAAVVDYRGKCFKRIRASKRRLTKNASLPINLARVILRKFPREIAKRDFQKTTDFSRKKPLSLK